jgi:hypothetical protein
MMDPVLFGVLLFILALTLVFGVAVFTGPDAGLGRADYRLVSGWFFLPFVLLPALFGVLVLQWGALPRLAAEGIEPHPGIRNPVGITVGAAAFTRGSPTWLFTFDPGESGGLEFYESRETRPGWELLEASPGMVILGRDEERMAVSITGNSRRPTIQYLRMPQ